MSPTATGAGGRKAGGDVSAVTPAGAFWLVLLVGLAQSGRIGAGLGIRF